MVALAILAMLLFRSGEEAKVEALLRQALDEAKAGDAEKCIQHVAPDYAFDGQTYSDVCALIRRYVRTENWKRIELLDLDVGVEGDHATATMALLLEAVQANWFPYPRFKLDLHLKKVGETWKVSGYRVEQK